LKNGNKHPQMLEGIEIRNLVTVEFPYGLPGFEWLKRFNIAEVKDNPLFSLLYSTDEPDISMIIMKCPVAETSEELYKLVRKEIKRYFGANGNGVDIYFVVRLEKGEKKLIANYSAPIVVCRDRMVGYQLILEQDLSELICENSNVR